MEQSESRARIGQLLTSIGWAWVVLFAAAMFMPSTGTFMDEILGFFGGRLWVPFMLFFVGRALKRGAAQSSGSAGDQTATEDDRDEPVRTPPIFEGGYTPAPPPPPRPVERVREPRPRREPMPEPVPMTEVPEPEPPATSDERLISEMEAPTYKGKTSQERIEEAKKRLSGS